MKLLKIELMSERTELPMLHFHGRLAVRAEKAVQKLQLHEMCESLKIKCKHRDSPITAFADINLALLFFCDHQEYRQP